MSENIFYILFVMCFSLLIIFIIINIIDNFFKQKNHSLANGLNGLFIVLIFLIFVSFFLKFWLKVNIDSISISLLIIMTISMIFWHVCLFSFKDLQSAKIVAIISSAIAIVNIAYNWNNNDLYALSLIILCIWEICVAKVTFKLNEKQVLKL